VYHQISATLNPIKTWVLSSPAFSHNEFLHTEFHFSSKTKSLPHINVFEFFSKSCLRARNHEGKIKN